MRVDENVSNKILSSVYKSDTKGSYTITTKRLYMVVYPIPHSTITFHQAPL